MKLRTLANAALVACALGATSASAQRMLLVDQVRNEDSATSVTGFVESWQQRINNENLPVAEPKTWGIRNMAKFARLPAERFELAMHANTLDELEALLVSAPIESGTSLAMLKATKPGNVSFAGLPKADPTGSPTLYSDLAFTALSPCRIFDSRASQGGAGPMVNGVQRSIRVGPYPAAGGGYATGAGAQGGSATGCGVDTLAAGNEVAAVMLAASSFTQTAAGYLTFWSSGADPSASVVSMFYQPGYVQTAFVVVPTDRIAPVWFQGISRNANTELALDIVGYFAKPKAVALECVETYNPFTVIIAAGATTCDSIVPQCAAGYTSTSVVTRWLTGNMSSLGHVQADPSSPNTACYINTTGASSTMRTGIRCCRVPGR